ncbi:MAG: hypothetical protein M1830_002765, partial [Pleopsidium flavum]
MQVQTTASSKDSTSSPTSLHRSPAVQHLKSISGLYHQGSSARSLIDSPHEAVQVITTITPPTSATIANAYAKRLKSAKDVDPGLPNSELPTQTPQHHTTLRPEPGPASLIAQG